jgi:hypothetical protein
VQDRTTGFSIATRGKVKIKSKTRRMRWTQQVADAGRWWDSGQSLRIGKAGQVRQGRWEKE